MQLTNQLGEKIYPITKTELIIFDNSTSEMEATNVQEAIEEVFQSVSNGKKLLASAITDKGIPTSNEDSFETIANNIRKISNGPSVVTILVNVLKYDNSNCDEISVKYTCNNNSYSSEKNSIGKYTKHFIENGEYTISIEGYNKSQYYCESTIQTIQCEAGNVYTVNFILNESTKLFLYNYGEEYIDLTGGYAISYVGGTGTNSTAKLSDCLLLKCKFDNYKDSIRCNISSKKTIDLTEYSRLNFEVASNNTTKGTVRLGCASKQATDLDTLGYLARYQSAGETFEKKIVSVDISFIEQHAYINVGSYNLGGTTESFVYAIWLER